MDRAVFTISGTLQETTRSKNGGYMHNFLIGRKLISVYSKENGYKPGEIVDIPINFHGDFEIPNMVFKIEQKPQSNPGSTAKK